MKVYKVIEHYQIFAHNYDQARSLRIIDLERVVAICQTKSSAKEYINKTCGKLTYQGKSNVVEWSPNGVRWFLTEEESTFKQKFVIEEYELIH
jgi:hypothetical protein